MFSRYVCTLLHVRSSVARDYFSCSHKNARLSGVGMRQFARDIMISKFLGLKQKRYCFICMFRAWTVSILVVPVHHKSRASRWKMSSSREPEQGGGTPIIPKSDDTVHCLTYRGRMPGWANVFGPGRRQPKSSARLERHDGGPHHDTLMVSVCPNWLRRILL